MAYQFDITVCVDSESPTRHFAGTYTGVKPEIVTSISEVSQRNVTVYVMPFRITDSNGRGIQYNAFYTSTDKIYFSLNGHDLRSYSFPLAYTIFRESANVLVSGTIINCGEPEDDGSTGGSASSNPGSMTPNPSPPGDPCLPEQPQVTPPVVATPCSQSEVTPGPAGFGAS